MLKKGDDCDIPVAPEMDILKLPLYVIEDTYSTELGLLQRLHIGRACTKFRLAKLYLAL